MHTDFACLLFHHLRRRPHSDLVAAIITEAVEIEKIFLTEALPVSLIGMVRRARRPLALTRAERQTHVYLH